MSSNSKAWTALAGAVVTGAGFVAAAGVLHGTALVAVDAGIAAVDAAATTFGVYLTPNAPEPGAIIRAAPVTPAPPTPPAGV